MSFFRRNAWLMAFLGVVGGDLLIAMGIALDKDSGWWAAWGQWIGGLGSIAAAWVALWIAIEGWRRSDEGTKEQRRNAEERDEREAASRFGVWIEKPSLAKFSIQYHNAGTQPVYGSICEVATENSEISNSFDLEDLGPTTESKVLNYPTQSIASAIDQYVENNKGTPPPGMDPKLAAELTPVAEYGLRVRLIGTLKVRCQFRDANGVVWTREPDGQLFREARLGIDRNKALAEVMALIEKIGPPGQA